MLFYMVVGQSAPPNRIHQLPVDEELFSRIGQDDREALETLYQTTERAVYAYVLSLLKNPEDTLDIVQETYLKIRSAAHLYKPMGKPMAWIFTIARNLTLNHISKSARQSASDWTDLENNPQFAYVTDETDRLVLESALAILPEKDRQILLLHAVSGMKHREIAENLHMPLSTVLAKYSRSLKKLQKHLVEQGVRL